MTKWWNSKVAFEAAAVVTIDNHFTDGETSARCWSAFIGDFRLRFDYALDFGITSEALTAFTRLVSTTQGIFTAFLTTRTSQLIF